MQWRHVNNSSSSGTAVAFSDHRVLFVPRWTERERRRGERTSGFRHRVLAELFMRSREGKMETRNGNRDKSGNNTSSSCIGQDVYWKLGVHPELKRIVLQQIDWIPS